jgi:kinesin family protein C1
METELAPVDQGAVGKRKGMNPFPLSMSKGQITRDYLVIKPCKKATESKTLVLRSLRDISLSSAMDQLTLESERSSPPVPRDPIEPSPSLLPKPSPRPIRAGFSLPVTPCRVTKLRPPAKKLPFLTRDSNLVWDTKGRLEDMEYLYSELKDKMSGTTSERNVLEETVGVYKARSTSSSNLRHSIHEMLAIGQPTPPQRPFWRKLTHTLMTAVTELEAIRVQLTSNNNTLTKNLHDAEMRFSSTNSTLDNERREFEGELRSYAAQMDDIGRQHRYELDDTERKGRDLIDKARREARGEVDDAKRDARDEVDRLLKKHNEDLRELERRLKGEVEDERAQRIREAQQVNAELTIERQKANADKDSKEQEVRGAKDELDRAAAAIETKEMLVKNLRAELSETSARLLTVESSCRAQRARIDFLESDSSAQAQSFADAEQQMQDAISMAEEYKTKLRKEESLRRKLHNQVQELKGNIRVFCRVRPSLESDSLDATAKIAFPDGDKDSKEVEVNGPEEKSSLGNVTTKKNAFAFDRVFAPSSQNEEVFEEISQLVQSALDGYNVCIFCYGQTGSGKTYTMSASDGMIPRAVNQIYETALSLEEKGWKYTMEGSFVEVYNENINDLLGKADDFDKKKHDIHHDMQKRKTTITNLTTELLDCPGKVETILKRASNNRSVAATKANERSSRSHSVFILKLKGENRATGESSEGTLNLVDLAGSERLSQSQATGDRLKETQNINKSLSSLGDVIGALGQGKEGAHIPYRNSKVSLTDQPHSEAFTDSVHS